MGCVIFIYKNLVEKKILLIFPLINCLKLKSILPSIFYWLLLDCLLTNNVKAQEGLFE